MEWPHAPAATPPEVVNKLAAAVQKVLRDPAVKKILADQGSVPVGNSPDEFKKYLGEEIDKWGKLVKISGASVD